MTQKEQENFLKNAILIVDYSKTALITLVDLDLQNKSLTFEQFLNKNRHEAYHLCYKGKCCQCVPSYMLPSVRIIHPAQLELLYDKLSPKLTCHGRNSRLMTFPPVCCSFAQNGISTNVLDISLARCILTNFCHEVFWYSCLKFKGNSLEDFLNLNKHTIYHLLNNNTNCCLCPSGFIFPCDRPQIIQSEWNNMFSSLLLPCTNDRKRSNQGTTSICSVSATPGICIQHLDLNLQEVLLQYCCPLRKSVKDLADIRNVKYGHVQEARMSDADFKQVFNEIENNLMAIATVCGNVGEVKQSLQDLQNRTYQNSMLEHLRYVNEMKDIVEVCCKEVGSSVGKLRKDFSKEISSLANEKTVEAIANEVKDLKIRIPRKLDKYYMTTRREQRTVQHSVAKLAKQYKVQTKEVDQKITSVVESIGGFKRDMDTRLDTVENNIEMVSKNVEELVISLPEKVERCIEEKGVSKRSKLIGQTLLEIEDHSKEGTFVTTSVVSTCIQLLEKNNVLVLTGRAGSGKSRNSLEILRQFKNDGYDVIKLTDLKDFKSILLSNVNMVKTFILCEDIFGRTNNVFIKNSDTTILRGTNLCVNSKTKVIFTIRDIVKRSCNWLLSTLKIFHKNAEVDISSKELELKVVEKEEMFEGYCQVNNFKIVGFYESENFRDDVILDENVTVTLNRVTLNQIIKTEPLLGFPETCCLFTRNRKFTRLGEAFFKHPSSCLTEEIEHLRKSGKNKYSDAIKYSLLVYALLNGGSLDKNQININQMNDIVISCYHNGATTILEHDLFDAIDEMIGQYLIKKYDTNSYQFQHQTVLESVLISYSKINKLLILSKLDIDFIREMVRLDKFQEKEGEIVMKIPVKLYPKLCERIIDILKNEYSQKSQSLIKLLCDSEIMRENDVTFIEHLIDETHRVLPLKDLKIIVAFQDESESVNFYFPVALLEHIITHKNMTESLFPLLKHTQSIFQSDSNNEIIQSCKASVLSVFLSAVVQEHSEDILSLILKIIKDNKLTSDTDDYFTKVVCSTPPSNQKLMIWLLKNIGMEYLDRKAVCLEICFRTWTNLLHLLRKDPSTSGIDLTCLIKELCSSGKYEIVKWLVEKINCSFTSMDANINAKQDDSICWLLENVDQSTFNIQTAINEICTSGNIHIVQWFMHNYKSISVLDMEIVLNEACRAGNICVVAWLIESTDKSLFDLNKAILAACLSKRNDLITLLVDSLDPLSFEMNILLRMCRKEQSGVVNQLLRIIRHFTLPEVIDCARKACEQDKLEIVQWLVKALNSNNYLKSNSRLDMKMAINIACQGEDEIHILEFLLQSVVHKQLDLKTGIETAIREDNIKCVQMLLKCDAHQSIYTNIALNYACRFNRIDIIKTLLQSVSSTAIDIPTMISVLDKGIELNRPDIAKCVIDKCDHSLFGMKRIFTEACYNEKLEILGFLITFVDHKMFELNEAIYAAFDDEFPKISLRVIELLLKHSDRSLLDMAHIRKILHCACRNDEINKIKILVAHFDNLTLDMKTAMNNAYRYFCLHNNLFRVMEFLASTVDNTLLGFDSVMNDACRDANLLVVQWLVKNVDNTLFDVKTALEHAIGEDKKNYKDRYFDFEIIELLLTKYNYENVLPYITNLKRLMRVSCMNFNMVIMHLLLEKVDNSLLGIDTVMNRACSTGRFDVVKWLIENVDNTLFDVKTALECVIGEREEDDGENKDFELEVSEFLLTRCIDEDVLQYITNFKKLMRVSCFNFHTVIMQLLIEKVDNSLLGIDNVMNQACSKGMTDEVKWLVEHVDNTFLNFNTAMSNICSRPDGLDLAKWLLANIDDTEIDINTSFINACSNGNHDLLKWLLETYERQSFDAKTALNVSCINGHFTAVKYLLKSFDIRYFDLATAIIKVCRSQSKDSVEIGKCLWNKFNPNVFDLAKAMNNACRYGNLDVAEWLFEMTDIDVFDMSEALNSACQCDKDVVVKWIISKIPLEKINVQKAITHICKNNSDDLSIIKVFVESREELGLDLNILVKAACTYERTDVIEWMLENCDKDSFRILDLLTSLVNIDNSLEINVIDKHDKSKRDSKKQNLILKILMNNTFLSCDYNSILSRACSECWIGIFRWILTEIDNTELNITDAVNIASKNGRCELINWSLSNLNPDQIDANTLLVEASGFGFIEVVQSISSRQDKCKLNFKNAMNDACEYGRGEVVTWLLKNNAKDVFDLSMVMSAACRNGWMDTLNWILENADYMLLNIDYAIIEACAAGNINIVQLLFSTFDKKLFDQQKLSATIYEKGCNEEVVLFLLENLNADVFQMDNILNKASGFGWLEVVTWIMKNGPEINTVGSAFENACVNCEIDIVEYLQDKISQENIQTGLQIACKSGFEEIVEVLLDCLNHELEIDIATLLNEACRCGEQTVVEVLLRKIDNALFDKRTAINKACRSILPEELVYFLIKDLPKNDFDYEVVSENARKNSWTKVLMQLKRKS